MFAPWKKSNDKPRQCIKKQRHYFADKGPYSQSYGFSSSHVWMWELDHKKRWALKNWCLWTMVLEKTLESPLDSKEIKPVNPKRNQSWIINGRIAAEAPILWPPDVKSWLTGKDPHAGKDWEQEEKGMTEDEMVGWHLWLNGHEFEQTLGDSGGQGSLAYCSLWGRKESDMAHQLNNNKKWKTICFTHSILAQSKVKEKVKSLSRVRLFATPWTVAYQAPPSLGFSRQEYWSRLPFPSTGDLPNPGIEPRSSALQVDALPSEPPGKPRHAVYAYNKKIFPQFLVL